MLRVVAVDDEKYMLESITSVLNKRADIKVVGQFTKPKEFLNWFKGHYKEIDAIFLDVAMPVLDGFAIANEVFNIERHISVIFVTAHDDFAVKAFKTDALDYIVKPATAERLDITLKRIYERKMQEKRIFQSDLQTYLGQLSRDALWEKKKLKGILMDRIEEKYENKLLLFRENNWEWVNKSEVSYFYKDKNSKYVKVAVAKGIYETTESLSDTKKNMDGEQLIRCYRNLFVNKKYIYGIEKNKSGERGASLSLVNSDIILPVSRGYLEAVILELNSNSINGS